MNLENLKGWGAFSLTERGGVDSKLMKGGGVILDK